jgi:WD40 repeat protein
LLQRSACKQLIQDPIDGAQSVLFLIYEQKYLELLEQGRAMEALDCLRKELTPLRQDFVRVHRLSRYIFALTSSAQHNESGAITNVSSICPLPHSLMMLTDANELKQRANWDGVHGSSRAKLLEKLRSMDPSRAWFCAHCLGSQRLHSMSSCTEYIPSSTLPPSRRLETLVLQALEFQKSHCLFHNTQDEPLSLLEDHACTLYALLLAKQPPAIAPQLVYLTLLNSVCLSIRDRLPRSPKHVLTAHTDEVWFVQFSHNGKFLASASRDKSAIIWNVQNGVLSLPLA